MSPIKQEKLHVYMATAAAGVRTKQWSAVVPLENEHNNLSKLARASQTHGYHSQVGKLGHILPFAFLPFSLKSKL